jgi:predicted DNA-binding protein (MmcQ/YjbR family)
MSDELTEPRDPLIALLARTAAAYPGATEDFPWGERVAKVGGKVFAFLGTDDSSEPSVSLKLPRSAHYALSLEACRPTAYGLGKAGWVSIQLGRPSSPEPELLLEWLEESYRARAGRSNLAALDTQKRP